jgi:hypothetical protein
MADRRPGWETQRRYQDRPFGAHELLQRMLFHHIAVSKKRGGDEKQRPRGRLYQSPQCRSFGGVK